MIRDRSGNNLLTYEIGPYEVDQDLVLECEVTGGVPAPKVTWWKGEHLLDSSDEVTRRGSVVNRLVHRGLRREDLGAKFVCQASNTNMTLPAKREVKTLLNCEYSIDVLYSMLWWEVGWRWVKATKWRQFLVVIYGAISSFCALCQ